jgi:hypothetical protein
MYEGRLGGGCFAGMLALIVKRVYQIYCNTDGIIEHVHAISDILDKIIIIP